MAPKLAAKRPAAAAKKPAAAPATAPAARQPRVAASTTADQRKWLQQNSQREGVVSLPSGLQYRIVREGAGGRSPLPSTVCEVHYVGTLTDGTEFDSSRRRGRPAAFAPNQVIAGWTEALQLMGEGDVWELYLPSELAYGKAGRSDERRG